MLDIFKELIFYLSLKKLPTSKFSISFFCKAVPWFLICNVFFFAMLNCDRYYKHSDFVLVVLSNSIHTHCTKI